MSILSNILNIVLSNVWTIIVSLFIAFIVYQVMVMCIKVRSLPPGPLPLPLIGNILEFRAPGHWSDVLKKCGQKYGPVFTFWIGDSPHIFIADIDIGREAFKKSEFCGRPDGYIKRLFSNKKFQDIAWTDSGHTLDTLRGVTISAVNKYSKNDKLVYLVRDCVEQTVNNMIAKEGLNREFCPKEFIHLLFLNITTTLTFGINSSNSDVYPRIKAMVMDIVKEAGVRPVLWMFSILIKLLDWKMVAKIENAINDYNNSMHTLYVNNEKDYDESIERNICDAVITAKNIALREGKESANILTDKNLAMCMGDLIVAGTETSATAMSWAILFMTYKPEFQKILRKEIKSEIGDRLPTQEDRNRCHYVMAFISEIIRVRNLLVCGLPHTTQTDTKLEGYTIPKGTGIAVLQLTISTDEKHFPNGQQFRPERFLEDRKYITNLSKANIPFGVGRRICLGEKLAIADLFLVLVRFLQLTANYDILLGTNEGIEPYPYQAETLAPKQFKIIIKSK